MENTKAKIEVKMITDVGDVVVVAVVVVTVEVAVAATAAAVIIIAERRIEAQYKRRSHLKCRAVTDLCQA